MDDILVRVDCKSDTDWLAKAVSAVRRDGCCIVGKVIDEPMLDEIRPAMYRAQERIVNEVGESRLARAGELGVLRLMMKFEPVFFRLLAIPEALALVDALVSSTAILHLQNGFILPSLPEAETPKIFQNTYHRDFPRHLNGYVASINTFFAIDAFTKINGATLVIPRSHQHDASPSETKIQADSVHVECPQGSMVVFDSTLWHSAGLNTSGKDRLAINQQFTCSWIKQQIDYVRAIGEDIVRKQVARTQQLLGYYTRVVTSLDEYYRPEDGRLYRRGQG